MHAGRAEAGVGLVAPASDEARLARALEATERRGEAVAVLTRAIAARVCAVTDFAEETVRARTTEVAAWERVAGACVGARLSYASIEVLARQTEVSSCAVALVAMRTCRHAGSAMLTGVDRACVEHLTVATGVTALAGARVVASFQRVAAPEAARRSGADVEVLALPPEEVARAVARVRGGGRVPAGGSVLTQRQHARVHVLAQVAVETVGADALVRVVGCVAAARVVLARMRQTQVGSLAPLPVVQHLITNKCDKRNKT